ncbi:2824_t:CDS:2 [Cetraspora pellucida]|uniref:2824_t:CDS:1 n=1 Tax=Cetraspora pellucida TaxID=1433469 RepID=A0A9N9K3M6_9GLOM|nr:2824_t:CDS:2 [Cetraspora pellucida]
MWQVVAISVTEQEFECFVSAWTDRYFHLGNKVTSQVEAAHAILKRCLESVHHKIVLQVESQAREMRAIISSQHIKICDEWIKASTATLDSSLRPCTRTLRTTMRLPCSHVISKCLAANQPLQLVDIHEHWWIQGRRIEFLKPTYLVNDDCTDLQPLLQSLKRMYQFWPPNQQSTICSQLENLVNTPPIVLENPVTH